MDEIERDRYCPVCGVITLSGMCSTCKAARQERIDQAARAIFAARFVSGENDLPRNIHFKQESIESASGDAYEAAAALESARARFIAAQGKAQESGEGLK